MFQRLAVAALMIPMMAACSQTSTVPTAPESAAPAVAVVATAAPSAAPTPTYPLSEEGALAIAAKLGLVNPVTVLYRSAEKHAAAHNVKVKGDAFNRYVWMMNTGKRRVCVDASNGEVLEDVK